jgi:hypothetical protein
VAERDLGDSDELDATGDLDEPWERRGAVGGGSGYRLRKGNRTRQAHQRPGDIPRRAQRGKAVAPGPVRERPAVRRQRADRPEEFRCRHCRTLVGPVPSGGRHRNHCPACLYSRHVDERLPGDRLSPCGGSMAPVGAFLRAGGEHMLLHRCLTCGVERRNRIAADDNYDLVLSLPDVTQQLAEFGADATERDAP